MSSPLIDPTGESMSWVKWILRTKLHRYPSVPALPISRPKTASTSRSSRSTASIVGWLEGWGREPRMSHKLQGTISEALHRTDSNGYWIQARKSISRMGHVNPHRSSWPWISLSTLELIHPHQVVSKTVPKGIW